MTFRNSARLMSAAILFAGMLGSSAVTAGEGSDWPSWRGPEGNGISDEEDWDPLALKDDPKILWRRPVGRANSTFTVLGEKAYTQGAKGEGPHTSEFSIVCLDTGKGREVWRYGYPPDPNVGAMPNSTPVTDGTSVYCLSNAGTVYCIDDKTGELSWKKDLVAELKAEVPEYGMSGSPLIVDDLLVLNACRSGVALDKKSGKLKWASGKGKCGYASPVLVEKGKSKYIALFCEKSLNLIDVKNGRVKFSRQWVTHFNANAADPVVWKNALFITSGYKAGCALLNMSNGAVMWKSEEIASHYPSPVIIDDFVYAVSGQVSSSSTNLKCFDLLHGKEAWTGKTGFGSFVVAGGVIVFLGRRGDLIAVKADPASYQEIARCTLKTGPQTGDGFTSGPVLSRGKLYCRSASGTVFCIDVAKK